MKNKNRPQQILLGGVYRGGWFHICGGEDKPLNIKISDYIKCFKHLVCHESWKCRDVVAKKSFHQFVTPADMCMALLGLNTRKTIE